MSKTTKWTEDNSRKTASKKLSAVAADIAKLKSKLTVDGVLITDQRERILSLPFEKLRQDLQMGSLSAVDVLHAYQAKALLSREKLNNVTEFIPEAEAWAHQRDKVPIMERKMLHGIPISVKDMIFIQGTDCFNGITKHLFQPRTENALIVNTLMHQGAVPFCKTNMPAAAKSYSTNNSIYGVTRNPHDPQREAGGSTGGEASLIGDGGSILGLGTDLRGSIRFPCFACGIYGIKPSIGRLSMMGIFANRKVNIGLQSTCGFLSNSLDGLVRGMEAVLTDDYMHCRDSKIVPLKWNAEITSCKRKLKIGYIGGVEAFPLTPACARALQMTVEALQESGHLLVKVELPFTKASEVSLGFARVQEFYTFNDILDGEIIDNPLICDMRKTWIDADRNPTMSEFLEACHKNNDLVNESISVFKDQSLDVIIGPIFPTSALPLNGGIKNLYDLYYESLVTLFLYNLVNFPSAAFPVTKVSQQDIDLLDEYGEKYPAMGYIKELSYGTLGMPVGIQLAALPWQDELLCNSMIQLQASLENSRTCNKIYD